MSVFVPKLTLVLLLFLIDHFALAHPPQTEPSVSGFILRPDEGEILVNTTERTENIKLSPRNGALGFGLVTTRMVGAKQNISVHRHLDEQEAFFVHRGKGMFILGERRIEVREGDLVFIPQGVWHGFENGEGESLLLWVDSPPIYLGLHRIFMQFDKLKLPQPAPETEDFIIQQFGYEKEPKNKIEKP
jgi:mannose-6-phosphate isomerase-like protein (cupin superfamily)